MRALYEVIPYMSQIACKLIFEVTPSPRIIVESEVLKTFRFDTAKKSFADIPKHYAIDGATDAISILRPKLPISKLKSILRTNKY